jgi:metallo-beta-lactamase family protein
LFAVVPSCILSLLAASTSFYLRSGGTMEIRFFGGARTVTGSQHLLSVNGEKILLECGLFQGPRSETYRKNLTFEHDPGEIDCVLLSHAHIDHAGNLPNLCKSGYSKNIYATSATVDLCQILLRDSAYLQEKDVEWVNKIHASKNEPPVEPLYTIDDAEQALRQFVGIQYERPFRVATGVTATFRDAGHILGSAGIVLEIEEDGTKKRVGFSGDLGRKDMPIIRDPKLLENLDALIMESTYGNRDHEDPSGAEGELADLINHTVERGGKVIIPAFAVGRTQHIIYVLNELFEKNRVPRIPVYVDSPMACSAIEVYRSHPECFDRDAYFRFFNDAEDLFEPAGFTCVRHAESSKRLNELTEPHIIIAASGMAEGGRVLHHLRNNVGEPRNTVLFVGFAAEHTLARRLMDGEKQVKIFGEEHRVKCAVVSMPYFSAHADRSGLLDLVLRTPPERLRKIFLVHGEMSQAEALREKTLERGYTDIVIPERLSSHVI